MSIKTSEKPQPIYKEVRGRLIISSVFLPALQVEQSDNKSICLEEFVKEFVNRKVLIIIQEIP